MGMRLSLFSIQADILAKLSADPTSLFRLLTHADAEGNLNLDKEWHGIHFLLTGEPWPLSHPLGMAIFGAEDIGEDLGYGPARTLSVEQVHDLAAKLALVTAQDLRQRYNPKIMTGAAVYPEVWEREGQEALEWLMTGFERLTTFYSEASSKGRAVVLAIL